MTEYEKGSAVGQASESGHLIVEMAKHMKDNQPDLVTAIMKFTAYWEDRYRTVHAPVIAETNYGI